MYLDILEAFWKSASYEEVALDSGDSKLRVTCTIKDVSITFSDEDFNQALELLEENLHPVATEQELVEFTKLIHYEANIDLEILNKKHVKKEWSFMFESMLKVFAGRKTSWDHISYPAQHLVYSLAYNKPINVGRLIIKDLVGRFGKSPAKRGNEIFFPRFIQSVLNFKNSKLIELEGTNAGIASPCPKFYLAHWMLKILWMCLSKSNLI